MILDVPGPKLGPFNKDSGPLTIEFLEILGDGLDGQVWKVHIDNQLYALKIVRDVMSNFPRPRLNKILSFFTVIWTSTLRFVMIHFTKQS